MKRFAQLLSTHENVSMRFLLLFFLIFNTYQFFGQQLNYSQSQFGLPFQNNFQLLSSEQLTAFWEDAKARGYNLSSVPQLLQESGYSLNESLNITSQIRQMEGLKYNSQFGNISNGLNEEEEKIFGLSIFRSYYSNYNQTNNLPTPENYVLGIGDQISVVLYGETDANYKLTINKEGKVVIPFVGPFSLQGLSLQSARSLIKQKLSSIHAGLYGSEPTVFLEINLTNLRSITISILGEAMRPGNYSISPNFSLINALYLSQGPTVNGTLRNIKIYRSNKLLKVIDLYDYLLKGITTDISFRDQDVIVIDTYAKRVELTGAVRNPGIYEIKDENIYELVEMAGGFIAGADKESVTHKRYNGSDQFVRSINIKTISTKLEDGDILNIESLQDFDIEKIQITGAINRPGYYDISLNEGLEELINSAGGFRDDALKSRIAIFQNRNSIKPSVMAFNALKDDISKIKIKDLNSVFIPSTLGLTEVEYVTIEGSISRQGPIPFYKGMTVLDAIIFANGISDTAIEGTVEVVRSNSLKGNEGYEFFKLNIPSRVEEIEIFELNPRDKIFVRDNVYNSYNETVSVLGEVSQPGNYVINPGFTRVFDIIARTGNLSNTANLNGFKLYRLIETSNKDQDVPKLSRINSIANFLQDPRFEGSVSTLQGSKILDDLLELENSLEKNDSITPNQVKGVSKLNGFKISKDFLLNNKNVEFLEIGLSYNEIMSDYNSQYNVTLLDGDILFVPPTANLVEIDGNVYSPTQAIFRKEKSFKDYIETAGGLMRRSDIKRAYIEYSNGEIKRVKSFLVFRTYPSVETDSRIFIPVKPAGSTISFDRIISVITSSVSTYLLLQAVSTSSGN